MASAAVQVLRRAFRQRESSVTTRLFVGVFVLATLLTAAAAVATTLGPVSISLGHVVSIVLAPVGLDFAPYTRTEELVVVQLRFPRIIVAALVGKSR